MTLSLRAYRTTLDADRTVFFASVDRSIPIVAGVYVIGPDGVQAERIVAAAREAGLTALARRYADGRRALAIVDRRAAS